MTSVIQEAGSVGSRHHYTDTATVSNFDSKARVTLGLTNRQNGLFSFDFNYTAVVVLPPSTPTAVPTPTP